jgi:hypothetical protein
MFARFAFDPGGGIGVNNQIERRSNFEWIGGQFTGTKLTGTVTPWFVGCEHHMALERASQPGLRNGPFPLPQPFGNLRRKRDHWGGPIMEYWVQIAVGTAALLALAASAIEGARLWRGWRRTHR